MFPFIAVHAARRTFILLCLLPTMSVITWATARRFPGGSARAAHQLGQVLRLEAEVTHFETLRPGEVAYRQLQLRDPITHESLMSFPETLNLRQVRDTREMHAARLELQLLALPRLVTWFQTHVYDSVARTEGEFTWSVDAVALCHRDEKWDLGAFTATVRITPIQSELTLELANPEDTLQRSPFLHVHGLCHHGTTTPESSWEMDIRQIPLRWVAPFWNDATQFGTQTQWRSGKVVWHANYQEQPTVTLQNCVMEQVELSHVSAKWLDAPLQGTATVNLVNWDISPQTQRGQAYVQCPQGSLDSVWLEMLKTDGRLAPGRREVRSFTELNVEVKRDQHRWTLGPIRSTLRPTESLPVLRDEQSASLVNLRQPVSLSVRPR